MVEVMVVEMMGVILVEMGVLVLLRMMRKMTSFAAGSSRARTSG